MDASRPSSTFSRTVSELNKLDLLEGPPEPERERPAGPDPRDVAVVQE